MAEAANKLPVKIEKKPSEPIICDASVVARRRPSTADRSRFRRFRKGLLELSIPPFDVRG